MNSTSSLRFSTWLRQQRRARDWTQDDLAIQVDCSVVTIRRFEQDGNRPSRQVAELLATCFAIPETERADFIRWVRQAPGAQPPPSVTAMFQQAEASTASAPLRGQRLPVPPTQLIGRETEVERIRGLLSGDEVRLLTLTGPGGSGKTRIALAVASAWDSEHPGHTAFVPLATIRDPDSAGQIIPQAADALAQTPLPNDGYHLLVLDNFEHILSAADILGCLLEQDSHLKILVTSRVILHLYGEYEFDVQPLAVPDSRHAPTVEELSQVAAVRLFLQRAQAVRPGFALTQENAAAVDAICRQMDGLPLALELAAAQIKTLPPHVLLARLDDRFTLLTTGPRNVEARQQTLWNTMDWSYHLLEPAEQRVFTRLAVFVGSFALEAAAAVCRDSPDDGPELVNCLVALVDKSLVQRGEGVKGEVRFAMLETVREYAWTRLNETGEAAFFQARHADYYLDLLEALCAQPLDLDVEMPWFSTEKANLYAIYHRAISQGDLEIVERLGAALWELGMGTHLEALTAAGWEPLL